jgi:hypothetical protein
MESGRKSILVGLVLLFIAIGIIVWTYAGRPTTRRVDTSAADAGAAPSVANQTPSPVASKTEANNKVAEVRTKSSDPSTKKSEQERADGKDNPWDYGRTTPVDGNTNPQVRSVSEALRDKNHPERLSALIPPKPFDATSYKSDPKSYLNTVEPGRCFQSAQPGKDVPRLRPLSPQLQSVAQGQFVVLKVQVAPKAPCSFTSFDLGKFQNELTAITVEANEKGEAETKFYGTPGTINEVKILAASPTSSGHARFMVNVTK